jgi:hypothetical protein
MSGNHRAVPEAGKARVAVAGALTAGALLFAPVGAAVIVAPAGVANAARPGAPGPGTPGAPGGPAPTVHKKVIHLPGLKIEVKDTVGDHKPPKIKVVPFPGVHLPPRPQ